MVLGFILFLKWCKVKRWSDEYIPGLRDDLRAKLLDLPTEKVKTRFIDVHL